MFIPIREVLGLRAFFGFCIAQTQGIQVVGVGCNVFGTLLKLLSSRLKSWTPKSQRIRPKHPLPKSRVSGLLHTEAENEAGCHERLCYVCGWWRLDVAFAWFLSPTAI